MLYKITLICCYNFLPYHPYLSGKFGDMITGISDYSDYRLLWLVTTLISDYSLLIQTNEA